MKITVTILFLFTFLISFSQNTEILNTKTPIQQNQIDSVTKLFEKYKKNNIENFTIIQLSEQIYEFYKISQPDTAIKYAAYGLEIAKKNNDSIKIALFNKKIGDVFYNNKIYYQAMDAYFTALVIYQEKGLQKEYAYSLIDIANTHFKEGVNNSFALNYYFEAINIFENINDNNGLAECYDKIALINSDENDYNKALDYAIKSLSIRQQMGDKKQISNSYFDIAKIHQQKGEYETAINYFKYSIVEYENNPLIGNNYFEIANTYLLKKQYQESITNLAIALELFQKQEDDLKITEIYNLYSVIYFKIKEYIKAIEYAQKSLLISEKKSFLESKQNAYLNLSNIYSEKGEIELALRSYHKYSEIRELIFHNKTQDKYTELQVSIKTQLQEKQNQLLTKEKELNELQNKQQKTAIYIILIVAIFLLILSIILFRMFQLKRKNAKRLSEFADASQIGIAIHDGKKILEVNSKFCELTKYSHDELIGTSFMKLIPPEERNFIKKQTDLSKKLFYEVSHIRKDGSLFLAEVFSQPFTFQKKKVKVVSLRDITDIRRATKELKETQYRYKTLLDASPDGVVITDKNGIITYVSDALIELFEYNNEKEFIGKDFSLFITPNFVKKFNLDIKNIIKGKNLGISEYIAFQKNNEKFYIECNGELVKDENGKISGAFLIVRDISERKLTENALIESEARFRGLFDNAKDAIIIQNDKHQIIDANPYTTILFGFSYHELVKMNFYNLINSKYNHKINLENFAKSGEIFETSAIHKEKEDINISISISKVYFSDKDFYLLIIRDITERKKNEKYLMNYADKLQIINATKDKMFSIIAHDLRSPIGNLKAMIEFILENPDEFEKNEINDILYSLKDSSVATYELLENLLNWAKSQQNLIDYNPKIYNLSEIVSHSVKIYANPAKRKNILLQNNVQTKINALFDINMIRTVLRNLIHNAIKFTKEKGEIIINYELQKNYIVISISDNGVGIDKKNNAKLFKQNQFFTTYGTNQEKGTGIGLALCKEFVEKNNGKIWVESELNKGTTFYFTIRRA